MTAPAARTLLLLTAIPGESDPPVLSTADCRRMDPWLRRAGSDWATLSEPGILDRLASASPPPVPVPRLRPLLHRSARLDALLDRWSAAGFAPVGLFDDAYPRRLKRRLGDDAPPVLLRRGPAAAPNRGGTLLHGLPPDAIADALRSVDPLLLLAGDRLASRLPDDRPPPLLVATGPDAAPPDGPALTLPAPDPSGPSDLGPLLLLALALADAAVFGADPPPPVPVLARALDASWQPVWLHPGAPGRLAPLRALGARPLPATLPAPAALSRFLRTEPDVRPPPPPHVPAPRPHLVATGFAEAPAPFGTDATRPSPPLRAPTPLRVVPGGATTPSPTPDPPPAEPIAADPFFALFLRTLLPLLRERPLGLAPLATALNLDRAQLRIWLLRAEQAGRLRHDPATATWTLVGSGHA